MTIAGLQPPGFLVDFSADPRCMVCEPRGGSDVWSSTEVQQRYFLPRVPEPDSLGQSPCRDKERDSFPFIFLPGESFSSFYCMMVLMNSPINNYRVAEGTENRGRQWGNGIIMRCGVSIIVEMGNYRDH